MRDEQARFGERLKPVRGHRRPHPDQRSLHEAKVQRAHHLLAVLRHLTALPQPELTLRTLGRGLRGEPDLLQGGGQPPTASSSIQSPERGCLQDQGWRPGYLDDVGFTLISLLAGFVIAAAVDLHLLSWLVALIAVGGVAAGILR